MAEAQSRHLINLLGHEPRTKRVAKYLRTGLRPKAFTQRKPT
jgi:hypothetical protein